MSRITVDCCASGSTLAECFLVKRTGPILTPADDDAKEFLDKMKLGQSVKCKITRSRNVRYHRKWFSLARFAFDYWEPNTTDWETASPGMLQALEKAGISVEKNFDRFRKDLIILSGYYEATPQLNGKIRIEAKSIAFDAMEEDEFEKLFSATVQVVINKICTDLDEQMVRNAVDEALSYLC